MAFPHEMDFVIIYFQLQDVVAGFCSSCDFSRQDKDRIDQSDRAVLEEPNWVAFAQSHSSLATRQVRSPGAPLETNTHMVKYPTM